MPTRIRVAMRAAAVLLAAVVASPTPGAGIDSAVAANARLPIPVSQLVGDADRKLAPDVRTAVFMAYRAYLRDYDVAWRRFGVALEKLRAAESSPLVLQASSVARAAREELVSASRRIVDLNADLLRQLSAAGAIDSAQANRIEADVELRSAREELSWRLGRVNPAALWDPDAVLDALEIAPSTRDALRPGGESWRVAARAALRAARDEVSDVFERAAGLLEQDGWAPDPQGRLRRAPTAEWKDPVEAQKECWRLISPPVLATVRRVEELNWARVFETTRALPPENRLRYLGANLLGMSAQADDGAFERLLDGRYARPGCGPAVAAILDAHVAEKLGLLAPMAGAIAEVRGQRSLAIATEIDGRSVQRLETSIRTLHELNRRTLARLQAVDTGSNLDCRPPVPPADWGTHERDAARALAPLPSDQVAGTLESRRREPGGPAGLGASSGTAGSQRIDAVRRRIAAEDLPALAAQWQRAQREFKGESSTSLALDESLLDRYCAAESAYVARCWELLATAVGAADADGAAGRAWRVRYLVDLAATTHGDPFGGLADAWRFTLLDDPAGSGDAAAPSARHAAYCDRVLPLLEARLRSWSEWRRASILVRCSDAVAWRIRFQPGHADDEVEPAIRQRRDLQAGLAAATAALRGAEWRVIEAVLAIIDERIGSGDPAGVALRQGLLLRCIPGSEADLLERLLERLQGHEVGIAPESLADSAIWCSSLTDLDLAAIRRRLQEPFEDEGTVDPDAWQRVRSADLAYARDRAWHAFQRQQIARLLAAGSRPTGK